MIDATEITTPKGEPELTVLDGTDGMVRLVLNANGFEACLRMNT